VFGEKRAFLERLYNFHWIVPGEAARSAQGAAPPFARILKRRGIKSLVNLRGHHPNYLWWRREKRLCARLGMAHFDVMLDSRRLPMRQMLASLLDAFDKAPRPLVVKCSGGQDRTALAASIYLIQKRGWGALPDAKAHFARFPYLHFPKRGQKWLEQFPRYAEFAARGRPIAEWIRNDYDTEAFDAWLRENGMGDSFKSVFTLPWTPHRPRWLRLWT